MIPQGSALSPEETAEIEQQTSRTYRIDLAAGRVAGMVDGLDAIKQAAFKALSTERFQQLIYSSDYGSELSGLAGGNQAFVQSELRRRIREALLADDRIVSVDDMRFRFDGDSVLVEFVVVSRYGQFSMTREVGR